MKTMMEMALLQKVQEQEMMLSPASSAIPTAGCSQGAASFAQERIWLNEKIHYDPSVSPAMHNFVLPLVIKHGSMSIERIRSAISAVLEQYEILRTAIYFDENRNMLVQAVQSVVNNGAYSFEITANDIQSLDEVADLLRNESVKHFAELEQGLVVRCHLVKVGSDDDMDKLHPQDLLIFIFHGVTFDYNSIGPFLGAFTKAYDQVEMDVERLQYISFSLYEHQPFINIPEDSQIRRAQQFWSKMMDDYSLDTNYPTPFTRPFDTKKRSGEGHSTSFILDSMLVEVQVKFASLYGLSMFHTALACFFLFIYELNDGTISDLCVTCPTENRSFIDTKCMIGTFANLLPYRIKINANESFINLVQQICKLDMDILNHCQLPYQQIIKGNRELCSSKIPFHFQYEEIHSSSISEMKSIAKTNDATLSLYTEQPWLHGNGIASHDMNLKMVHNQFSQTTYCIFECSADCYDEVTVSNIGRYFQTLLLYTFTENTKTIGFDPVFEKIGNLSLLPMNVETLSNIIESLRHFSEIKPASYAQRQIWLDEERRLHLDEPQLATYNMVFCYRLSADHTMSVQQLRYALDLVVDKHQSLRTSFVFDTTKNILTQRIVDQQNHKNNRFSIVESIYETDEQLDEIIHNETHNPHVFDLTQGLVFRCHLVRYKQVSTNDLIADNDIIIFNFHHASFDRPSMKIFLHDLHQAYTTSQLLNDDNTNNRLRYLDYAVIEQHMPMIGASMFWHDALHNYKLYQSLSLPYDRYRPTNEYRSGFGTSISFDLDRDLCDTFLHYTSSQNISIEHLALSMYFVFLFKLTNEQTDLCIGMNVDGRYRDELKSVIGMFVNAIPLRCQLDPQCFLHELIKHVQEILTNSRKYSYFPLQRLLDQHSHASKPAFVDTSFQFIRYSPQDLGKDVIIGDSHLSVMPTTMKIGEGNIMSSQINKPIYELSLILSNEQYLMQSLNNTQTSFSSDPSTCIHHEFVYQVMKHPQKLAVELDEQSLTYAELLYYVQVLSLTLLNEYHVFPGEIVCQCVERSLSMVIGIMGIEMAGGVYCPLSPRDPQHRLYALTQQTQSRLVLVHDLTKTKFDHDIISLDIGSILNTNDINKKGLSTVILKGEDIAYIIFTSGSTGTPKVVQVRHKNFIDCMHSLVYINSFNKDDTVVQMTRCSFDIHVQEILGTLLVGGTLIMLQPGGTIDFDYLSEVLQKKQITYLHTVPSLLHSFFTSIEKSNSSNVLKHLRSLCSSGEPFSVPLIALIVKIGITNCITWNLYGPAEATIDCTVHRVDVINDTQSISIGRPLFNYRCIIMNQYLQSSAINQEGELFVGGVGVFVGYLGRDDLTVKALVEIDGQLFYRTGDLVRIDNNCLLHYQGRKDHQIKLHGQRIELGEIERCLLNITSISACVVLKWNDDYLVAYAQSSHMNEEQLRQHCQSHLPPHMIPSIFIILEKLPLNQNGKIDRKLLPSPHYSSSTMSSLSELDKPVNQMEKNVYDIWCQVLEHNRRHISTTTNFLTIGGHSRLFIELYHRYQSVFNFDAHTLSIVPFLQQPTIFQHSQLLQTVMMNNITTTQWYTLHINEGVASFTQERIFLDEQVRFSSDIAIYNELLAFQVVQGSLSLNRLLQALRYVLNKHKILRTSLMFNNDNSSLKQCITDIHATFAITMNQTFANENELRDITYQTTINPNLFNLSTGRVFHAEIVRHQISLNENNSHDLITISDVLLIVFHHAAYDRSSFSIFFDDLCLAYNTNTISIEDDESLHYIDYSVQERLIDMTTSREFWYLQLEGYNLEYRLLPVNRHRLSDDHRSSCASVTQISFDNEISQSFLDYASMHHVTPFQLGLTILYAFLFKLTHGENDLCLSCLNANRHKTELQNIMGMFVSTLPYRVQLDPQWSFADLVKYVREKCLSILEHSHYPLQHILANLHINQSNISFLEAVYDFITISSRSNELSLDGASLKQASFEQSFEVAKFDFMLIFVYNPMLENNRLSFRLTCSHDLFDGITVRNIGRRLEYCFQQLFSSNETIDRVDTCFTSISKFDLILLQETQEMEDAVLCRQSYIINEAPASFAQIQLWHNERVDFTSHISQVPIYNMPFVYQLHPHHTLSVQHLCHALQLIVIKHEALRTSLTFHTENNRLIQQIAAFHQNDNTLFSFIESTYTTHEQLNHIIHDEKYNPQLFDLAQGLVIRCHLVYYKDISSNHRLSKKDIIIFNFHHAMFDFPSMNIFLHDLNEAYTTGQLLYDDNTNLRYLDYAVIEQQMSMSGASMFWLDTLHDCKLDQSLSLPFDRYRLANEHRTDRGTSISFDFGQDLSYSFLIHALSNEMSLEHLIFAIYFIFLFKLTNGQTDLCIAMNINNNRYRHELKSIIGLFENVIPLRCELDPHWSFYQLLEHVQEITTDSMKYSYFPLQRILNQHPHISTHAFLDTSLEFISNMSNNSIMIGDSELVLGSFSFNMNEDEILIASDFSLSIYHDLDMNQLSCTINGSLDLFNRDTVEKISQRFHFISNQLSTSIIGSQINKPICELTLLLSNEQYLMQSLNNTQISFSSPFTCIHHEFVYQVMKHPQKLAVELDEQSLTYAELLYYVQMLSLTLLDEYCIAPGEIVCQCIERSLSMVIGMMSIEMSGGVYCPLSPRDPQHRLYTLVQQTQSRLVLVHHLTKTKFNDNNILLCIDSVLTGKGHKERIDVDRLSDILVTPYSIAYIIFTSGSTGIPKAAQIQQWNVTQCEPFTVDLINLLGSYNTEKCNIWNLYGPAETIICTYYHVQSVTNRITIPIGLTMPNYRCLIFDLYLQSVIIHQEGELYVGGVGVFAGYLERNDLTAQVLFHIDDEIFYRTGDLVRMDNNGLLHYQGRKDHQIKLHGQRIELGEIERCLLIESISSCVVVKYNDDHLVAYVQSSHITEEQLRRHCLSHLPPHMIPSIFIILEKLPLNPNGKIDRKLLPSPNFSSIHLTNSIELLLPTNDIEVSIHHIWCEIFKRNQISTDTNIFTMGGHSLLMMQLFHLYKTEFHLEQKQNAVSIFNLFQHPTIIYHAQLIQQCINIIHSLDNSPWSSLHLIQARASFAQERIYLDEQIRFSSKETAMNNMYVIPLLYRISSMNDHVSFTRFHQAFQSVITKHNILRTALYIDDTNGHIIQHCLDANIILNDDHMRSYQLTVVNIYNDDDHYMNETIAEILNKADLFDLSKGRVIRYHILRHCHQFQDSISYENDDLLTENDHILISVHHAMFDGASTSIFCRDLSLAYQSDDFLSVDENALNYIDYSVHEHIMNMSLSREFWHSQLERYNIECSLSLPYDRQRSSTDQQRSGLASIAEIIFDNEIYTSFLNYASSHHLTYFQLGLATFYTFLFKLTHGETDLCISSVNANRYRSELVNMIGMFVSTLPYRVELDPHWSFDQVVKYVQEKCLSILEHSHYPLQHILSDLHLTQSNVSFLETIFDFITIPNEGNDLSLNGVNLEQVSLNETYEMAKFDSLLRFEYNPLSDNKRLSCCFVCSRDLFEQSTISQIAQRFQYMFQQLFQTKSSNTPEIDLSSSINEVSLILPEEVAEMELVVFHRLENIVNEAPASFTQARIWLDERIRFDPDKPQTAIYNMPFVYRLQQGHTLSTKQLRHALQPTVNKHPSLHTSLHFDSQKNLLMQRVITHEDKNNNNMFSIIETTYETDEQLNEILHDEKRNPHIFDLAQGLVFRCHIIYYKQISLNHLLSDHEIVIFNFHHAMFDFSSMNIFLHDLNEAYTTDEQYLMQSLNNTQISFSSPHACIHHEFVCQAMKHPQKLAVELDEQSVTYCELLYYVQVLSLTLLNEYHLFPGEIVCQCVERSLSMVIGIMGIEMAGGVYCPLSPRDAQHRLRAFTQQTQSRLILVHYLTKMKFSHDIVLFDMDSILNVNIDKKCLSRVIMKSEEITYIIFTSGSTGTPKAVQLRQQSFINSTLAFVRIDALHENDVTIQIASVAFDAHILEIVGSLICGATIMMLHPHGETVSSAFIKILMQFVAQSCRIWNFYGPAETTLGTTCHLIDVTSPMHDLPIGKPLPSYICLLLNNFSQPVMIQEGGDLLVGGLGVFAGYLGRDDLTAKALVEIDDELFYRTGDVVRMDSNGLLYYQGRKDHQIKLHGQRIELGEIEQCLLRASISVCVVIRGSDDHLVAYVQSSNVDEKQLRQHCQSHLPPYMIPSFFIILDKLPLNANGKIDRKALPIQTTLFHSPDTIHHQHIEPSNELEIYIHSLWCQILCHTRISIDANFFGIGGHSLLLIQLYHNYKITLNIDTTRINISKLFQYTTIADHARLVRQSVDDLETYQKLLSAVHNTQETSIRKVACSISQENIILVIDELSRYEPFPVTNIQLAYLVGREGVFDLGHVSTFHYKEYSFTSTFDIECFERALNCLIQRHEALRLIFPSHTEQRILKTVPYYTISVLNLGDVESSRKHLIERREQLSHQVRPADQWPLFDFQITRFISDDEYKIRLHFGIDALIMDFWSTNLILHELNQLYCNSNDILVELKLSYRDYILTEEQWKNTTIYSNDRQYWINRLKSFPLGPDLPLQCLPNEIHVQRHCNVATVLGLSLWQKLRKRIIDHELTPAGFLASIYALVLGKWSENKHFALNLPVFNRLPIHPQVNQIVGDFTTVVPLEINFDKVITYYEFLHTVQKQLWNDVEHISYDGVSFIRDLMQMHQTREILLPYVFTCAIDVEDIREKNVEHNIFYDNKLVYVISQTPQVFIDHGVLETDGCLSINWVYVDNLLRKEMVIHIHDTFVDLLVKLASFDDLWQNPIFIPLPSEQQERRLDFNQTQWESNIKEKLLHSLVIKQAELTPNALAIVSSQVNLTYEQLLNRVYSLAYHLQQQHEMKSNQLIAILMTKGWEQIVACLAIFVSGSAYLPLDIDSPYDRLFSLIEETNVTILLTQSHSKHAFPHITTISVDTFTTDDNYPMPFPIKQQSSTDLAYVIYTSGSTGKPKGVMISHQAVVNTILDMNSRLKITSNDRIFALSHLNFDLSVYDIFGILIDGGTIVIPDHEDYKNPEHWYDMMVEHRVTIWNSVPMLMQMFVEHLKHTNNHNNQLRHILLSGDWIPLSLPESIQTTLGEQVTITSLGGATEASIWSIAYTLPKEIPREWKSIPYGIPLRNQQYYVYDIHLDDCPEWVIGELYIGGEGLANGYWNDQEKTQSSFIIHSLTNERLYRTGDYGRFLPTGYIEFTGRKDFQVKVHGHRIELGEIEH
ncbi:unnamed protein product, partial [Adineta steineri]